MASAQLETLLAQVRRLYAGWDQDADIARIRRDWDAFFGAVHLPARVTPVDAGGVPCHWIEAPESSRDRVIVFIHGGGYQIGSHRSHHNLMARLSGRSGRAVLSIGYRLAPQARCPAALEDVDAAHAWLAGQGWAARQTALCGDSAGGALAVLLLARLRERGAALPAACAVMSPWIDLQARGESYAANAASDPIANRATVLRMARAYLGRDGDPEAPAISAQHADLRGLPPLLVQAGSAEALLDDARALAARAAASGVAVRLSVWQDMPHVFQLFAARLDAADAAIAELADFINHPLRAVRGDAEPHHETST
ncbi:alpha/beta hydrolase fold domain-containing protein [Bordetella genomosp. 6]|uniref:alpha/beta hydrolase fold domain-containing protein n=1 Tax=Bordetella genomosp. 6 TaxID=463024 RepID=UPI000A28E596|nr:alpha/beta hydrolase fold domain-containing protein [Bordetella genomosp. 6]ARP75082.1 lipase [Bordetella genomosp. 6]